MQWMNSKNNFGFGTRVLHALTFILIFVQLIIGIFMDDISNKALQGNAYVFHKSLGVVIFFIALIFVIWRALNVKPQWPIQMAAWERWLANSIHFLLYLFIVLMPLSGWIMSTAANKPPNFFWLGPLPLPGVPLSKSISEVGANLHYIFAWILGILIIIHLLGALWHYFIKRDNIMRRIWRN